MNSDLDGIQIWWNCGLVFVDDCFLVPQGCPQVVRSWRDVKCPKHWIIFRPDWINSHTPEARWFGKGHYCFMRVRPGRLVRCKRVHCDERVLRFNGQRGRGTEFDA